MSKTNFFLDLLKIYENEFKYYVINEYIQQETKTILPRFTRERIEYNRQKIVPKLEEEIQDAGRRLLLTNYLVLTQWQNMHDVENEWELLVPMSRVYGIDIADGGYRSGELEENLMEPIVYSKMEMHDVIKKIWEVCFDSKMPHKDKFLTDEEKDYYFKSLLLYYIKPLGNPFSGQDRRMSSVTEHLVTPHMIGISDKIERTMEDITGIPFLSRKGSIQTFYMLNEIREILDEELTIEDSEIYYDLIDDNEDVNIEMFVNGIKKLKPWFDSNPELYQELGFIEMDIINLDGESEQDIIYNMFAFLRLVIQLNIPNLDSDWIIDETLDCIFAILRDSREIALSEMYSQYPDNQKYVSEQRRVQKITYDTLKNSFDKITMENIYKITLALNLTKNAVHNNGSMMDYLNIFLTDNPPIFAYNITFIYPYDDIMDVQNIYEIFDQEYTEYFNYYGDNDQLGDTIYYIAQNENVNNLDPEEFGFSTQRNISTEIINDLDSNFNSWGRLDQFFSFLSNLETKQPYVLALWIYDLIGLGVDEKIKKVLDL